MTCDNKRKVDSENWRQPDPQQPVGKNRQDFRKKKTQS